MISKFLPQSYKFIYIRLQIEQCAVIQIVFLLTLKKKNRK